MRKIVLTLIFVAGGALLSGCGIGIFDSADSTIKSMEDNFMKACEHWANNNPNRGHQYMDRALEDLKNLVDEHDFSEKEALKEWANVVLEVLTDEKWSLRDLDLINRYQAEFNLRYL